ncbi:hypothetical protein [Burkholderia gladioli]|uniref:hypothetical protein n=1 Tax=Burkholderia gladioli TaxID=28095 RepID=UPI00163F40F7|nr:hypothetical protein [Burkholderia gladioli]
MNTSQQNSAPAPDDSTHVQPPAANVARAGLFNGIAVVIDDAISQGDGAHADGINSILSAIKDSGGHAVVLDKLPPADDPLDGFSNAAFFIMDWNLRSTEIAQLAPEARGLILGSIKEEYEQANIEFLKKLRGKRHAPVFIMTNESVDHVTDCLHHNNVMGDKGGEHIMVKPKSEVGANLYQVLEQWLSETPSALLLKHFEKNQTHAMNDLFNEFYDRNKYWPIIFWNAYKDDGVSPQAQLGELINRLVDARMKTLDVDLDSYTDAAEEHFGINAKGYKESLHAVLQSERLLPNEILDPNEFAPGDLFKDPEGHDKLWLNVRPICDCVQRSGSDGEVYLLPGKEIDEAKLTELADHSTGNFREKDNETIVFALIDGKTYTFSYRKLTKKKFTAYKDHRLGRVLPPFLTKITQRYAAYSHRPGLPRVPSALMPPMPAAPAPSAQTGHQVASTATAAPPAHTQ